VCLAFKEEVATSDCRSALASLRAHLDWHLHRDARLQRRSRGNGNRDSDPAVAVLISKRPRSVVFRGQRDLELGIGFPCWKDARGRQDDEVFHRISKCSKRALGEVATWRRNVEQWLCFHPELHILWGVRHVRRHVLHPDLTKWAESSARQLANRGLG